MRIILGSLLLSFLVLANAADTMTLTIDKNQKDFLVTLPSNPTTGYQWTVVSFDKSFLELKASQYLPPKTKLIGAGGQMQFNFALIARKTYPASTTMQFKYLRSWEPETGTLKTVTVNFQ
ncbi:putative secreted protein [Legionella massiliensis]|uniref:Putative secreted protein n=1 Tax=Legionella massiliensis TaxID=1034943 RepID=A0A078L270_9GAMM|nr:protease inhibitor I42 family protein [Legionella massiliensis]CDZ78174.1 putative secreted protein [Legionella massiliensis]CEE13912.1 Chagasin family peptidase inhibitor I42 [Legionella massiliensis]